jgi:hypothetical protein
MSTELQELKDLKEAAEIYGWEDDNPTYISRMETIQKKYEVLGKNQLKEAKHKPRGGRAGSGEKKRMFLQWTQIGSYVKSFEQGKKKLAEHWETSDDQLKKDRPHKSFTTLKKQRMNYERWVLKTDPSVKGRILESSASAKVYLVQIGEQKEHGDEDDDDDDEEEEEDDDDDDDGAAEDGKEDEEEEVNVAQKKPASAPAPAKKAPPKPAAKSVKPPPPVAKEPAKEPVKKTKAAHVAAVAAGGMESGTRGAKRARGAA